MPRPWTGPAICALAAALLACSSDITPESQARNNRSVHEQFWSEQGLDSYSFDFQQQCFCVPEQVQPVTIEVRENRVARVIARETGRELPADGTLRWPTIVDLFASIAEAEAAAVQPVVVRYDPRAGYPSHVEIGSLAADAGVIYSVSNVQPLQ